MKVEYKIIQKNWLFKNYYDYNYFISQIKNITILYKHKFIKSYSMSPSKKNKKKDPNNC